MAFQQAQQRPQAPRQHSHTPDVAPAAPPPPVYQRPADEEWILFSPQTEEASLSYTSQTPRTATHLSDFGSLETHIRSQPRGDASDNLTHAGTDLDDDGAELDSLDDGLHAFHHPFSATSHNALDQSAAVLPTHDGFGTFPSGMGLQEQLWQFERHNPQRRIKLNRRRSSLQRRLDAMGEEPELEVEDERTARIEKWRIEQSRAVLEEIERETRRRRRKMARSSDAGVSPSARGQDNANKAARSEQPPSESFWRRITRRVIQDLIGLDENTLSVIFGEELADVDSSPTPTETSPIATAAAKESRVTFHDGKHSWENKLLERIARELGVLVHQLADNDGAAFSTYRNTLEEPIEYAGLPRNFPRQPSLRQRMRSERQRAQVAAPATDASFSPTIPQAPLTPDTNHTDTSLWGIEEEPENTAETEEAFQARNEREYWEREVDVNMIFNFLKNRFSRAATAQKSHTVTTEDASGPLPASWATENPASVFGTSPESLRRAEVIRRQHPLVSRAAERAAQHRRRESLLRRHHMHHQLLLLRRSGSSSCASHSTKRSRQHTRSGSSRHFWDFGGSSVGSGPAAVAGGWGEV